jgi:hypothetical protein
MALGDWENFFTSGHTYGFSLELAGPIQGNGSLNFFHANPAAVTAAHLQRKSTFPRGHTKGSIRTLVKVVAFVGGTYTGPGIQAMQSQLNMANSTGSSYFAYLGTGAAGGLWAFRVGKYVAGLNAVSGPQEFVAQGPTFGMVLSSFWPMEFEWVLDQENLGGIRLTTRLGTINTTSYTSLTTVSDLVHAVNPLTTSTAEGIGWAAGTAPGSGSNFLFDNTDRHRG